MAKTSFTDGVTRVMATWLNAVFGHIHDGVDDDGHAPKVDDATCIDFDNASHLMRVYSDLEDAVADTIPGTLATVDECSTQRLSVRWQNTTTSGDGVKVACNGRYVVWADSLQVVHCKDLDGTLHWNYTCSSTVGAIAMDETYVFVADGTTLRCFDASTGTQSGSPWPIDHGATIYACVSDGESVYFGGKIGTGTITHRRYLIADGTSEATDDHGAAVRGIATDGTYVYVVGDRSPGDTYILRKQTSSLVDVDQVSDAYTDGLAVSLGIDLVLVVKEHHASSENTIIAYNKYLQQIWGSDLYLLNDVCADDRYAYVTGEEAMVAHLFAVYDLKTGVQVNHSYLADPYAVATDGFRLYVAHQRSSSNALSCYNLGRAAKVKTNASGKYRPWHHWAMLVD